MSRSQSDLRTIVIQSATVTSYCICVGTDTDHGLDMVAHSFMPETENGEAVELHLHCQDCGQTTVFARVSS